MAETRELDWQFTCCYIFDDDVLWESAFNRMSSLYKDDIRPSLGKLESRTELTAFARLTSFTNVRRHFPGCSGSIDF